MQAYVAVILVVLAVAIYTDIKTGKIKNWLTLPAIAAGPVVNMLAGGKEAAVLSLEGLGTMLFVAVLLISLKVMGGGDVKLLVAVGSLGGLPIVLPSLLGTGISGGVLALIVLIRQKQATNTFKQMAQASYLRVGFGVTCQGSIQGKTKIPYSIAIAAGVVFGLLWSQWG